MELSGTFERQLYRAAGLPSGNAITQRLRIINRKIVDGEDHVTVLETRVICGAALEDICHQNTV